MKEIILKRTAELKQLLNIKDDLYELMVSQIGREYRIPSVTLAGFKGAVDHTVLSYDASLDDVVRVCREAGENGFKAICVNPVWVKYAANLKKENGYNFLIASVVDFPLGASTLASRIAETRQAISDGADEIDLVISVGMLKSGMLKETFSLIKEVIKSGPSYYKIILETSSLTLEEKIDAALISVAAGADMLKTSTGVNGKATVEDVRLLRTVAGNRLGVKAAGGIRDKETVVAMMNAGADRIGCSGSVNIAENW